jgi:two-component system, chemotaxis family, sensor kinase CheA
MMGKRGGKDMDYRNDPLLEAFLYETNQMLERSEVILIESEKRQSFDKDSIDEIFRIMHTVKGSSAMMEFQCISETAHSVEDLFSYIRAHQPPLDYQKVGDIMLDVIDFLKTEMLKIENGEPLVTVCSDAKPHIDQYLLVLKGQVVPSDTETIMDHKEKDEHPLMKEAHYEVWIKFEENCEMESLRAFSVKMQFQQIGTIVDTIPKDLDDIDKTTTEIRKKGVTYYINTDFREEDLMAYVHKNIVYLDRVRIRSIQQVEEKKETIKKSELEEKVALKSMSKQNFINVNVQKLDKLMDMMGELVISEVMVTKNPEITKLKMKNFMKASNQLRKIINELQDIVMSIRMVPIGPTFMNMQRIVRDMCRKLEKEVDLVISGEEIEVDKNIVEGISDPLMHLIRNAIDHGIETREERIQQGKPEKGKISLEAKNENGDVWVTLKDDGKGLNRAAILKKAREKGLFDEADQTLSDQEVWNFILMPGFSTKDKVTEFSGRGVGMDVVMKNIENIGGRLTIESKHGKGSLFSIKIPLTLAIISGMEVAVGQSRFTIPITLIREAFRPRGNQLIIDGNGHEAMMVRGECVEVVRLHRVFSLETGIEDLQQGILILVENESKTYGIFADKLIGEHEVVVKPVPDYMGKVQGISGCTILGDGNISMIIDVAGLSEISKIKSMIGAKV